MPAATMQQPTIPPRPSRGSDKSSSSASMPKIPPRPINKRLERSISPSSDRFAPSPLSGGIVNKPPPQHTAFGLGSRNASSDHLEDPIERSGSVPMPSVGEEGMEYGAFGEEDYVQQEEPPKPAQASPKQTASVAEDLKLHAPKPSLPALSAKQRVATVTRTDSDRAASFGIGRATATADDRPALESSHKKSSASISASSDHGGQTDDEQGIPEIGQRVPMNPLLGDVQAPSPAPGEAGAKRHHHRKHSARALPPGSYGLHGHGVAPQDKLEKAYYDKHPDVAEKEHHTGQIHERQNDFAMSSMDLNRLVRDTASRQGGNGSSELQGTPTDEVAFQASEEFTTRLSSPRPASAKVDHGASPLSSSVRVAVADEDGNIIHVDDPKHPEYRSYGDEDAVGDDEDHEYNAPILASDEVAKETPTYMMQPAVHPPPERRGSAFEMEDAPSRPTSRPSSRPVSIHNNLSNQDFGSTALEDVEEYEPLFPEGSKAEKQAKFDAVNNRHHFPSKDIWEDAPNSVHYTAEVSTPDLGEQERRKSAELLGERSMTPAQAFAQHQEELAEKEAGQNQTSRQERSGHLPEEKPTWAGHQAQVLAGGRPGMAKRFPSRDIWEDAPESQLHQAVLSSSPEDNKPSIPARPVKKSPSNSERPAVPGRPKPKQSSQDDVKPKPVISDKPKPQVPTRPSKRASGDDKEAEPATASAAKTKPPVPSRPVGGKIAALQAGFMSDLNKRLQLGPQGQKKDEPAEAEQAKEEKEKIPLSDARKGRARGPARRAPVKASTAPAVAAEGSQPSAVTLVFSVPQLSWEIDPEDGAINMENKSADPVAEEKEPHNLVEQTSGEDKFDEKPEEVIEEKEAESDLKPEEKAQELGAAEYLPESGEAVDPPEPKPAEGEPVTEEKSKDLEESEPHEEEKTLVSNTAGESVLETTVEKKDDGNEVDPVEVDDSVKP